MSERKVLDETWELTRTDVENVGDWVLSMFTDDEDAPEFIADFPVEEEARARLAAAAPEMARLLVELERYECGQGKCGICRVRGHEPDCRLIAVLRKAGVRE